MAKRLGYKAAIELVALNDDCDETELEFIAASVSVSLVADIFGVDRDKAARDVLEVRRRDCDNAQRETGLRD